MRGKHGEAAAVRHEVQERDAEIATYQRRVAQLTAEVKTLKDDRRTQRQAWAKRERELVSRVELAASPKIEALEMVIKRRVEQRDAALADHQKIRTLWGKAFKNLCDHYRVDHGLHGTDAVEASLQLAEFPFLGIVQEDRMEQLPSGAVRLIQKRRGERGGGHPNNWSSDRSSL